MRACFLMTCIFLSLSFAVLARAEGASGSGEQKLEKEIISFYLVGTQPGGMPEVIAAINEACKDTLNIELQVTFAGWDNYGNKLSMELAAGQSYSFVYDAAWCSLNSNLPAGYYMPLDDLIYEHAPNLVAAKTESVLTSNMYKGPDGEYRIYGIPNGNFLGEAPQFWVRGDLREAMGIEPIKSMEDLVKYAYALKENYPDMTPMTPGKLTDSYAGTASRFLKQELSGYMNNTDLGNAGILFYKDNDGKVYNIFDDMPTQIWDAILMARQLYLDGIIDPDFLTVPDWQAKFVEGKTGIIVKADIGVNGDVEDQLRLSVPDGKIEAVCLYDFSKDGLYTTNFKAWDFIFMPVNCPNPERSLQFLNWVNENQTNYDLCAMGIAGYTYEPIGEKQYTAYSDKWEWMTWRWIRTAAYERYDANYTEDDLSKIARFQDPSFFAKSVVSGFTFDSAPVRNDISIYNVVLDKYWPLIVNGAIDPEEGMSKFREEVYPYVKKIQDEMQEQIDEFLEKGR